MAYSDNGYGRRLKIILALFTGTFAAMVLFVSLADAKIRNGGFILTLLLILITVLLARKSKKDIQVMEQRKKARVKNEKRENAIRERGDITGVHIYGLPVAEGTDARIIRNPEKFLIKVAGNTFELEKKKITDVSIKSEEEIEKQIISSAGGAVAGGMLFGALGAAVLGRAKERTIKNERHDYLIITYYSEEVKVICFEISGDNIEKAQSETNKYHENKAPRITL